jgi:hypothetical protein
MRWIRARTRRASLLALAAMALRLVLSFEHVHLEGIPSIGGAGASLASERAASPVAPAQHPANDTKDYCAICAIIHLASTSFVPSAPPLPVPFAIRAIEHSDRVALIFVTQQRAAFESRAPPLA